MIEENEARKRRWGELFNRAVEKRAINLGGKTKFAAAEADFANVFDPPRGVDAIRLYRRGASWPHRRNREQDTELIVKYGLEQCGMDQSWGQSMLKLVDHPGLSDLATPPTQEQVSAIGNGVLKSPEAFEVPTGAVKLHDPCYIERGADEELKQLMLKFGNIITIRAPRQTGKSSLLARGIDFATTQGARVVKIDIQRVGGQEVLVNLDQFLRAIAFMIFRQLRLDLSEVDQNWGSSLPPTQKLTYLLEDFVLLEDMPPVVLAIDEADLLLQTHYYDDFFGLIRSWHNEAATNPQWQLINFILIISTEPYLLIRDKHQSPFNVGKRLELFDFDREQVHQLNQRYDLPLTSNEIDALMTLLDGHPYLTRVTLYEVALQNRSFATIIDTPTDDVGSFGEHLRRQLTLLHENPDLKEAMKQVIKHNRCGDDMLFFRLQRAGLVKGQTKDNCRCRCELYQRYLKEKLS